MRRLICGLVAGIAAVVTTTVASAAAYVGSYWVGGGAYCQTNPPVYTGQEAAALHFGGKPSDYWISIDPNVVTHTAWEDGDGDTSHLKTPWEGGISLGPVAEDYSFDFGEGYAKPWFGHEFSAYVGDNEWKNTTADSRDASINYVFRVDAVPEPATWALMLAGFGLVGATMRRQRLAAI